ncbi:uncharacterized protein LOC125608425 [Brassica napus]|uniref:uncharacterized protein LOC125608425 n=1 Tax=Brassica napus TaxID=3708 RepID=UPI002078C7B2|nr:uncharacterized protein LOC125608425 [Brassica napus]
MDFLSISIIPAARFYPNMGALNWHPLDLRHQQGLSLVAGLVGEPKETDDFTLNLVSLTLSHVKVEVDLTIPLPSVVEFTRESGPLPAKPAASTSKPKGKKSSNVNKDPTDKATDKGKSAPTNDPKDSAKSPGPSTSHEVPVSLAPPAASLSPQGSSAPSPLSQPPPVPIPWLSSHQPSFGTLLETHIKPHNLNHLMGKLCRGWNYTSNHLADDDGRIIVIWKDNISERTDLWVELLNTYQTFSLDTTPWMVGGDFNQILHPAEHSLLDVNSLTPPMVDFRDCLSQMGLSDLRFQGSFYSWKNRSPDRPVAKKLDRLLINSQILNLFPGCSAFFLPPLFSDHSPCLLNLDFKIPTSGTRPFKFFNYLTKHPGFHQLTPTTQLFELEKQANERWLFLRMIEESYFKQRSRINWLKEGDQNTTFFYRIVQTRLSYNTIRSFVLLSGAILTDPLDMSAHAVAHFTSILGPQPPARIRVVSTGEWFHSLTPYRFDQSYRVEMISVPSADEITRNFFLTSFMPSATNSTILTLVPKHTGASLITDFRPIACLNTLYKVVSRLLVKRLKPILAPLIVPNQTAFVRGRLLVENTSLAGELINGYHRENGTKRITIKVDIAKAFDTLSWNFLFSCLVAFNLPMEFISWIRACVCTTSFTVGYNGAINGFFKGTRGLRQGDPLSPYLFVIALNNLSLMLNKAAQDMRFNYHLNCSSSRLTHLCFADDLLIFMDGSLESVQAVLQVLREFELRSGLAVSMHKTSFFASGLTAMETDAIQASTGNIEAHHTARVSWNEVTKPKKEGGLGINDLLLWNKACCLKLIWLLFFQAGSVWVAWFKEEVLNGNLSNLWTTAPNRRFSWQVNKLLKLSPLIYEWIHLRVSNGLSCRFWSDNWSPFGSLTKYLQLGPQSSLGIPLTATLASLCSNNSWRLPSARSENQVQLHVHLTTIVLTDEEDYYEWEIDGKVEKAYSIGTVYHNLRALQGIASGGGVLLLLLFVCSVMWLLKAEITYTLNVLTLGEFGALLRLDVDCYRLELGPQS